MKPVGVFTWIGVSAVLSAATWYVSPAGSPSGNGSQSAPWDLQTGLNQPLASGDTLILETGTYTGTVSSALTGVVIAGAGATLNGSISINGTGSTLRDLTIYQSNTNRTLSSSAGITVYGPNTLLLHNVVHDVDYDGIEIWSPAANSVAYGNIAYFQGYDASDRGHGHCFYVQSNPGNSLLLENNICFDGFGWGLHAYTEGGHIDNITYWGNIAFNAGILATVKCAPAGNNNILTGGLVVAQSPTWTSNYSYYPKNGCTNANLGYQAGSQNAVLTNNWFVGSFPLVDWGAQGIQQSGNVSYNWNGAAPALTCFVLPDAYTPGRAHIAVYNLNGKAKSVSCNVATLGLPNGTQLHLQSAENYVGAPVQVSISNQKITVPLTGWSMAQPIGWPAPHSTLPFFGAFVVTQ